MATSSIATNFAIRDKKEANAFISALLPDSRSMVARINDTQSQIAKLQMKGMKK